MRQSARRKEDISKIETIEALLLITKEMVDTDSISADLLNLNNKFVNLPKSTLSDRFIADILSSGQKLMQYWDKDFCPLCTQKIANQELIKSINYRLQLIRDLSAQASELKVEAGTTKAKIESILSKINKVVTKIELIPELIEEKTQLSELGKITGKLVHSIEAISIGEKEIPLKEYNSLLSNIKRTFDELSKQCENLSKQWKLTEKDRKLIKAAELIGEVRGKLKDLGKYNSKIIKDEKYLLVSKELYSSFSETKKAKIQNVFDVIQNDMNQYYSFLHANDGHKNLRLKLSSGKRASLELKIESFGKKDEDPRAFSSEGHLDSLGLCIFLAFVKKFNRDCNLIILDDVVTTIDSGHRESICKLLQSEFSDHQIIITTHDEVWYRQLRAHHKAKNIDGNFTYKSIVNWTIDSGPIIRPYKSQWENIEEKLNNGDKSAGNDGRIYLEWLLETICELMEVHIVFRISGEYEIGHLLPPAKKTIRKND